jgi:hypothetical protein
MKQFIFSFSTDLKTWEECVDANGMYDALNKVKSKKKQMELVTHTSIQVKLKGIHYLQTA